MLIAIILQINREQEFLLYDSLEYLFTFRYIF